MPSFKHKVGSFLKEGDEF